MYAKIFMVPEYRPDGFLPIGIWSSSLEEIKERYTYNIFRKTLFNKLLVLIDDLKRIKCNRIYIDGSFITTKLKPNDIDVCWEEGTGSNYNLEKGGLPILFDPPFAKAFYGLDIFPARYMESSSGILFIDFFQRVKYSTEKKGIIALDI